MTVAQQRALEELLPAYELVAGQTVDLDGLFGRAGPTCLEIGTGNGDCILHCARTNPDTRYLGVEVHRPGIGHLLNQAAASNLGNLRVCVADAHQLLAALPAESLLTIFIFFPDPWPKARHHKRRLLKPVLFAALHRCLQRHGRLYLATDSDSYAEEIVAHLAALPAWLNLAGRGVEAPRPAARIRTRFEARALSAGRVIHEFVLARAN